MELIEQMYGDVFWSIAAAGFLAGMFFVIAVIGSIVLWAWWDQLHPRKP